MDTIYAWENDKYSPRSCYFPQIVSFLGYEPKTETRRLCGVEISTYRKKYGMTQKKLAAILGIRPGTLAGWERNRQRPSKELFSKLLALFADSTLLHENFCYSND